MARFVPRGFVHLSGLISFNEDIERRSVDSPGRSRHTPLGIRRGFGPQLVGYSGENHSHDGRGLGADLQYCVRWSDNGAAFAARTTCE